MACKLKRPGGLASAHAVKEIRIIFGGFNLVEQEFHRFDVVHGVEQFT
jgi:hypothetical protein